MNCGWLYLCPERDPSRADIGFLMKLKKNLAITRNATKDAFCDLRRKLKKLSTIKQQILTFIKAGVRLGLLYSTKR